MEMEGGDGGGEGGDGDGDGDDGGDVFKGWRGGRLSEVSFVQEL